MLTDAEVRHYHEQGYVVPANYRVPEATLNAMRRDLDRLIAANPHLSPDALFTPHEPDHGPQGLKGDRVWLDYAAIPEILDMVGQVIGPDFLLWGTTVFGKPAHSGKETPWHQDGEYWPIRPLATCTVWIAVDDATPENGCMRFLPGSHRARRLRPHATRDDPGLTLQQELLAGEVDESRAVDVALEAGRISLHDVYLSHGSAENRSDRPRRGMTLRLMPTTSLYDREEAARMHAERGGRTLAEHTVLLMRGTDRHGGNDFRVRC